MGGDGSDGYGCRNEKAGEEHAPGTGGVGITAVGIADVEGTEGSDNSGGCVAEGDTDYERDDDTEGVARGDFGGNFRGVKPEDGLPERCCHLFWVPFHRRIW